MERQPHEESKILWKLELESAKMLELTPEHQKLVNVVTKKIEDYTLTYAEYLLDITNYLEGVLDDAEPKEVIKNMCNHLIDKYGSEEVRPEQDQNGPSTIKRGRRSGKNTNNGGTKVLGKQLAELA